ncbi:hypothetical protein WAI74_14600, partial [Acinetobacter baumannii]
SYPSCNLNFSNLGKLYLQRLYATKPLIHKATNGANVTIDDLIKNILVDFPKNKSLSKYVN